VISYISGLASSLLKSGRYWWVYRHWLFPTLFILGENVCLKSTKHSEDTLPAVVCIFY